MIAAPPKPTFTKNRAATSGISAGRFRPKVAPTAAVESRASRSKERTRQESMIKRCQSVEVLSNDRMTRKSFDSTPPPLPPKSERPLENILNSSLANENVLIDEKVVDKVVEKVVDKVIEKPVEKTVKFSKASPEASPTSMASLKKPFHKRRSSGLLFGVEERELPAPDTVKETRKIFESGSGGRTPAPFLTKSQSTSSLYSASTTFSRSPTRDRTGDPLSNGRLARKKSDENLTTAPSLRMSSPQRRVTYVNYINNKSSLYRNNATTQKLNAATSTKPTLPTKPSNLTFARRDSAESDPSPATTAPVLPAKKNSIGSQTSAVDRKLTPSVTARKLSVDVSEELEEGMKAISNDSLKNIRQSGSTYIFSFQSDSALSKNQNHLPASTLASSPTSKQVGVIKPITRDTETSPVTKKDDADKEVIILKKEDRETEVPSPFLRSLKKTPLPESSKKDQKESIVEKTSTKFSTPPPPTTTWMSVSAAMRSERKPEETPAPKLPAEAPPVPATRNVRFVNDGQILTATPATIVSSSSDSSEDNEDSVNSFEPLPLPASTTTTTMTSVSSAARDPTPRQLDKNPHQFLPPASLPAKTVPSQPLERLLNPLVAAPRDPKPVNPVALSKELLPVVSKEDKPASPLTIRNEKSPSPPRSPLQSHDPSSAKSKKKASEPVSTSMVFNFVNSEKDVDHIENDGLDMSKRRNLKNSKVRKIFFSEKVSFCSTQFLLRRCFPEGFRVVPLLQVGIDL